MNVNDRVASACNKGTVTKVLPNGNILVHWDGFGGSAAEVSPDVAREYFYVIAPAPAQENPAT